jgi:hypothetical protein
MMYSPTEGRRYKRKEMALAGLYAIFLLATAGEFFYAIKTSNPHELKGEKVEKHEQIPVHLPEESKLDFIRMLKIRMRNQEN